MQPARGDGLLTTAEAAQLVRVTPATIRKWRSRRDQDGQPYLSPQGLDEHGRPLHTAEAVRAAERRVRERGLRTTGIDPRRLRRPLAACGARWPPDSKLTAAASEWGRWRR